MEAAALDIQFIKTLFDYGVPAALLFFAGLAIYLIMRRAGQFLGPIIRDLTTKHMSTMDAFETIGNGLLDQQRAQTELMKRHDDTLANHTTKLDEIHKAVVK